MGDPIVVEVKRIREEHAKKFNYDLGAIFADIQRQREASDREFVSFPAKRIEPVIKKPTTDRQAT